METEVARLLEGQMTGPEAARVAAVNSIFFGHGHKFLYDVQSLSEKLDNLGFAGIQVSSYRDSSSALGIFDSHADRFDHPPEISL